MIKSPRFQGYMWFFVGTVLVFFAIHQSNSTGEWDFFTIAFMALAANNYMIAFRSFALAAKIKHNDDKNKKK